MIAKQKNSSLYNRTRDWRSQRIDEIAIAYLHRTENECDNRPAASTSYNITYHNRSPNLVKGREAELRNESGQPSVVYTQSESTGSSTTNNDLAVIFYSIVSLENAGDDSTLDELQIEGEYARLLDNTTRERDAIRMSVIQACRPLSRPDVRKTNGVDVEKTARPPTLKLVHNEPNGVRKRGRPVVSQELSKSSLLSVRFSESEMERIESKADEEGISVSKWTRKTLLDYAKKVLQSVG
jgi:hypothetical protein